MAMEQRTLNIINICKGGTKYNDSDGSGCYVLTAIKKYMAEECAYNADWYSDRQVFDIMWAAMQDYLNNCDKPGAFMFELKNCFLHRPSITEAIASSFSFVRVRDKNGYINGFDDRLHKLDENKVDE